MRFKYRDLASEVVVRCPAGHPLVLRCHPVRHGKGGLVPFPTLYWLACPTVAAAIARLEHDGAIGRLEARIAADPELRSRIAADHDAYVHERSQALTPNERAAMEASGLWDAFQRRGIGGIVDRATVKCLHLHFAHHLARGSTIGAWIEREAVIAPCSAAPRAESSGKIERG